MCVHVCIFVSSSFHLPVTHAVPDSVKQQYEDNCKWIREASQHQLVRIIVLITS